MKKVHPLLVGVLIALALSATSAFGQLNYTFRMGNGANIDVTAGTILFDGAGQSGSGQGGFVNAVQGNLPIGFTFNFNGTDYTEFSVSSNGIMGLGSSWVTWDGYNWLMNAGNPPILAPFWDQLRVSGGVQGCGQPRVSYMTGGAAPSRYLVVEWREVDLVYRSPRWGTFQARLYEGSNTIEFYYSRMDPCDGCGQGYGCANTSASIGIAADASNFMSVTPQGASADVSTSSPNDYVDVLSTQIGDNSLYVFNPCNLILTGLAGPGNGGTLALNDGDTFFNNTVVQMGGSQTFTPFWSRMSDILCTGNLTMWIEGPDAADYYFGAPGNQFASISLDGGVRDTTAITFTPTGTGLRNATLTVTDGGSFVRTFNLAAYTPNVSYIGHIPEGGTAGMTTGDTLLMGKIVQRRGSQSFSPFTLLNVSPVDQFIDFEIYDPLGQYTIDPDGTLEAGGSTTPMITFAPTGFGPQPAMLTVNAGGEIRTFILNAISAAPGGDLSIGALVLDSNATLLTNTHACVGEQITSMLVTIRNTGYNDFIINGADFYRIDTTYGQGRPRYPFVRDAQGELIASADYVLTTVPNVAPSSSNQVVFPMVVPEGGTATFYITFTAQQPGKRFARAFIRTNGESRSGNDTDGVLTEGIVSFDLYGRGTGSRLSDNPGGGLPKAIVFPETHVGSTSDKQLVLYNPGECVLRVSLPFMDIVSGDVDEFTVVQKPSASIDPVTGDLLLAPGATETVTLRFKPRQHGSRRAGLRLMTNDSTIQIPGITERGVYYIDLYGPGKADIYAEDVDFGDALIGGTGPDQVRKPVRLKNTLNGPIVITRIIFDGVDTSEFKPDGTPGWPTLPIILNGGQEINLGVVFGPVAGGQPGPRVVMVKLVTEKGDTIQARLTGVAGTRTVAVTPTTVNLGPITLGKQARQAITITNSGTMTLTLQAPTLSAGSDFSIGNLPRLVIAPGQTEFLEVTYTPQTPGGSNATLTIPSNATGGPVQVNLNGTATKTKLVVVDPSQTVRREDVIDHGTLGRAENLNVTGVTGETIANGMALYQSVPNPARDEVEIGYRLGTAGDVRLELYDGAGRLLKVLDAGHRQEGEQRVRVDVRSLTNGVYHYRLNAGGSTLVRTLSIVR
jgi:Abnormal spindle-like microcephaly-assoc'd, ASPM-SPD-2-Hydin/Secretion system C-terminal sorting domain